MIRLGGISVDGDETSELVSRLRTRGNAPSIIAAEKIEEAVAGTDFTDLDDGEGDEVLAIMELWLQDVGLEGWRPGLFELRDKLDDDRRRRTKASRRLRRPT